MTVHRKAVALMDPIEAVARLAARAGERAESAQTRASGSASFDNADGTRTIIGPQAGSGDGAPSGQAIATHVGDTTPPPVPTGITAWSGDGSLHVMWDGTLSGDVPADFSHISILVDGKEVAQLSSAGSVTVGGVEAGATVSVTATAEDDACLADGTPAHNVSSPCAAVAVEIRDVAEEVKEKADAHAGQIEAIQADIEAYKQSATATYATKTEVDEKTGAITKTLTADYTKTVDLASTQAVKDAKKAGTDAQGSLSAYKTANDQAVADAKKAGTDAQSQLAGYKSSVQETYAEKTELAEAVNQLSSTMTSNYSAFTTYRTSNDTAVSKAQSDATNAQSTIDSYKTSNDKAVADAKSAGTTAQNQLSAYKSSNDAAVADAKSAGTTAQSNLDSYKTTTNQRLDELKNIADNAIETWYLKGAPSTSNAPAKDWTTDALRRQHAGDLYMDTDTGYSYRWSGTAWVQVKDSDVTKALKEIQTVKTTYTTKSELTATDKELSGKISDTLTTARSYTDSSLEQEVTARNAAIKAQADSISLDVSRTYTKSETFSAYQTDADGRIATANANASTAVSTAKTAASDAATAKTNASSAVSTANAASGTASKASTDAAAAVKTANAANGNASNAVTTANGAKSTANAASSTAQTAKSTADTAKSTADSAKAAADAVNRAAVKTYPYPNSLAVSNWVHLGDWSNTQDSHTLKIDLLSGSGFNAGTSQNSTVEIFVKDGWQSTPSATDAYGATVTLGQLDRSKCHVDVIATSATSCSIWVNIAYVYDAGSYTVAMTPGDTWTHSGAVSSTEPTGTKQNVAFLTNAEEANAAAGAAQTLANNAQSTANTAATNAAKAQKEIESVKTTYATKSELKATDTGLSGKVSDALTTAKSYTDGSVQREAIARDAAIKAQADSISLSVSKTYAKSETFSAYQSDADSRIATANSNASTAKSTAQTAAADAATAKTNASTAVSTANSASTSAANAVKTANDASTTASKASADATAAVKTANTASSNASSAVTTANGAVTTANAASSTANAAKTTAEGAASTASSAKSVADSASSTANAASTSASNAVSTANSANSKSDSAVRTANTAKSTADAAKSSASSAVSTANAANSTAGTAKSTADAAQAKADDAWARTLRVEVMSAPADAAGDTSLLTAYAFRGGELLSDQAVAMMGLLAWYVDGKRVATGGTYTCAAGTAVECRVEA